MPAFMEVEGETLKSLDYRNQLILAALEKKRIGRYYTMESQY